MQPIEEQFQPIADEYVKTEEDKDMSRYELEVNWPSVEKLLPAPPANVMDYGCGGGAYSLILDEEGYEVLAVDNIPEMVSKVPSMIKSKAWTYQDEPLDRLFEAIVAKLVVQFVENLPSFAKAMRKHLVKGGRLIISVPHPNKSRELVQDKSKATYLETIGMSGLQVTMIHREFDEYKNIIEAAGFKLTSTDEPIDQEAPEKPPKRLNMLFEAQ
jgi:2-polyprenyl-3-methyl-5-hydroxy-6-metoxy-1,4-benzoquinol methylase